MEQQGPGRFMLQRRGLALRVSGALASWVWLWVTAGPAGAGRVCRAEREAGTDSLGAFAGRRPQCPAGRWLSPATAPGCAQSLVGLETRAFEIWSGVAGTQASSVTENRV